MTLDSFPALRRWLLDHRWPVRDDAAERACAVAVADGRSLELVWAVEAGVVVIDAVSPAPATPEAWVARANAAAAHPGWLWSAADGTVRYRITLPLSSRGEVDAALVLRAMHAAATAPR